MKTEYDIIQVLERLGFYISSSGFVKLRDEKNASCKVYPKTNTCYDWGTHTSYNAFSLVNEFVFNNKIDLTNKKEVAKVFDWLNGNTTHDYSPKFSHTSNAKEYAYEIISIQEITNQRLIQYMIKQRAISLPTLRLFCKEVHFKHIETNKEYFGVGFINEVNSYAIRTPFFKRVLRQGKSFLKCDNPKGLVVFEGFIDFLSAYEYFLHTTKRDITKECDVVVLNGLNIYETFLLSFNYPHVSLYLDNDKNSRSGDIATQMFMYYRNTNQQIEKKQFNQVRQSLIKKEMILPKEYESNNVVKDKSSLYSDDKDFNEFYVKYKSQTK